MFRQFKRFYTRISFDILFVSLNFAHLFACIGLIAHTKPQINEYLPIKMCVIIIAKSPFIIMIVVAVANAWLNSEFYYHLLRVFGVHGSLSFKIESESELTVCFQLNMKLHKVIRISHQLKYGPQYFMLEPTKMIIIIIEKPLTAYSNVWIRRKIFFFWLFISISPQLEPIFQAGFA